MTLSIWLETSGGVQSIVDMVLQPRDGPRRLREHDDDTTVDYLAQYRLCSPTRSPTSYTVAAQPNLPNLPKAICLICPTVKR